MYNYTEDELTELLTEAEKAHAVFEKSETSQAIGWPRWYARFILADSKTLEKEQAQKDWR